jgi:hypothetical protein
MGTQTAELGVKSKRAESLGSARQQLILSIEAGQRANRRDGPFSAFSAPAGLITNAL